MPNPNQSAASGLVGLAERCEDASGPDRELGVAVFRAIGAPVPFQFANKLFALTFDAVCNAYFAEVSNDLRVRYEPPAYTASLDAARTLVPKGWTCWSVRSERIGTGNDGSVAEVSRLVGAEEERVFAHAATPALALCAAALRARSNDGGSHE